MTTINQHPDGRWHTYVRLNGRGVHLSGVSKEAVEAKIATTNKFVTKSTVDLNRVREDAARRAAVAELTKLTNEAAAQQAYQDSIAKFAPTLRVPDLRESRTLSSRPNHTWVLMCSDWHLGQSTTADSTGGLFTQTTAITRGQISKLADTLNYLHEIASSSEQIDDLYILGLGDLHEGDGMRPRQAVEIDGTVTEQCVTVVDTMADLIQNALRSFKHVILHNVGGNHDRTSAKPGNAGLGELAYHDTYAWLAGAFLEREFKEAITAGRVRLKNWKSFFGYDVIAGQRFVFEHGASFKTSSSSYGGIGWYPIQNAGTRYVQMLDGADIVCFGHFHQAACLPLGRGWQVLNGALPPSTSYVQSNFKKIATPCQILLDLHPSYGLSAYRPIYLPHDGIALPGEAWQVAADEQAVWEAVKS